ncbi:MAG: TIM barrel protein [Balneolaceae bacterium]|nr:TIM barrel protein [Balneolaceae bacterium]
MPKARSSEDVVVGAHPWVYAANLPNYDITPKLEQIFADMSYAGMEGVELMHHPLRSSEATQKIGELSEKHDLPVIGTSYGAPMWNRQKHSEILEDAETIITNLASVGGRTLGTSVGNTEGRKTPEQLDAQAELLQTLIAICEDNGVVLNLHNHTYEVEDDMHDLLGTLERLPGTPLGPDLNWLIRGA